MSATQGSDLMPCGHPESAVVSSGEGTSYCGECATQGSGRGRRLREFIGRYGFVAKNLAEVEEVLEALAALERIEKAARIARDALNAENEPNIERGWQKASDVLDAALASPDEATE